jgi:hypothetical protein
MAVDNRHSNAETDGGAHRLADLTVGLASPTWQCHVAYFGGEAPRVFYSLPTLFILRNYAISFDE